MPVYKDEKRNTWYVKLHYTDSSGAGRQKLKRGFKLLRDAKQWEKDFLNKVTGSPDMTFDSLVDLYLEDKKRTFKASTYRERIIQISNHILPYFKDKAISDITEKDIKEWQFDLMDTDGQHTGRPLSAGYRRTNYNVLTSIFNFAIKECGLAFNPCSKCGNLNEKPQKHMDFWTQEEFKKFIATFQQDEVYYTIFMMLYYTGMRIGELQALTPADIDKEKMTITISKTLARSQNGLVIQSPKTSSSNRTVAIPKFLCEIIAQYESRVYGLQPDQRLFTRVRTSINNQIRKHANKAGLQQIRVHDLRHSHASLLINLGYSPLEVAKRLGHEKPSITLDVYAHMFVSKQREIADKLQEIHVDLS